MKTILVTVFCFAIFSCETPSQQVDVSKDERPVISEVKTSNPQLSNPKSSASTQPVKSVGKPSAPVNMKYEILNAPAIGQPVNVKVYLSNTNSQKSVSAKLKTSAKLQSSSAQKIQFSSKSSPKTDSQIITVTPQAEGIHYIYIQASADVNGKQRFKSFAIPLEVGNVDWEAELKPQGTIKQDGNGGKVISMPAQ